MPIVSNTTVSREISSLQFNANDTLIVNLTATRSDGASTTESYTLQPDTVRAMLDVSPPDGYTMRQAIIAKVYIVLLELGLVTGDITTG